MSVALFLMVVLLRLINEGVICVKFGGLQIQLFVVLYARGLVSPCRPLITEFFILYRSAC